MPVPAPRAVTPISGVSRQAGTLCGVGTYTWFVSAIDPTSEPDGLTVLPPEDALLSAKPAPTDSDLVIDGLTDAEWAAFETALANR